VRRSTVVTISAAYTRIPLCRVNSSDEPPTDSAHIIGEPRNLKETAVPIIRIEMFPGRTLAQKRELVRLITDAVCNVAHTDPKNTHVIFSEHSVEDWAWDGKLYVDQDDDEA
jgi:4-oxalocrotonate tautomerase